MSKYCPYYRESLPIKIGYCLFGHISTTETKSSAQSIKTPHPPPHPRTRICPAGFKCLTRGGSICPYGFKNGQKKLDMASAKFHAEGTRKICPFYGISLPSKFGLCPMGCISKEAGHNFPSLNGSCPLGFKHIKQDNSMCPNGYKKATELADVNERDSKEKSSK